MKITKFFLISAGCFILSGCYTTSYNYRVINNTPYQIDSLDLICGIDNDKKTIKPFDTTEVFSLSYTSFLIPTNESVLCFTVQQYSDTLNNYKNSRGVAIPVSNFSTKENNVLKIILKEDPESTYNIFDIEINQNEF